MPGWRNGRRGGFKIRCPKGRVGSNPTPGTTNRQVSTLQNSLGSRLELGGPEAPIIMSRASIERKLVETSSEIKRIQLELVVIDEQLAHFVDSADDARLRALVSETPLSSKEHRDAERTVSALRGDRESWALRCAKLESRQDELLDQLMDSK